MRSLALILLLGLSTAALAEDAHLLFDSGKADAIRVTVQKLEGDRGTAVRADQTFHEGDALRVTLESNFSGFVYVLNQTSGSDTRVLLPSTALPDNAMAVHQTREFPASPAQLVFDSHQGVEVLRVVMARHHIPVYDDAVSHGGTLTGKDPYASEVGRAQLEHSGVVTLAARTRQLLVSVPSDDAAYVAVNGNRLGGNDAAAFEIHLKHE